MAANVLGLVSRKKLRDDKAERALTRLKGVLDYSEFKDVDMAIEVYQERVHFEICVACQMKLFRGSGDSVMKLIILNSEYLFIFCSSVTSFSDRPVDLLIMWSHILIY